jgi:hypothetical protein
MSRNLKLELLISQYIDAIWAEKPDERLIERLCLEVEAEAEAAGCENHKRLMALHTAE